MSVDQLGMLRLLDVRAVPDHLRIAPEMLAIVRAHRFGVRHERRAPAYRRMCGGVDVRSRNWSPLPPLPIETVDAHHDRAAGEPGKPAVMAQPDVHEEPHVEALC